MWTLRLALHSQMHNSAFSEGPQRAEPLAQVGKGMQRGFLRTRTLFGPLARTRLLIPYRGLRQAGKGKPMFSVNLTGLHKQTHFGRKFPEEF